MKRRMFIGLFVGTMFLTLMGLSNRSFVGATAGDIAAMLAIESGVLGTLAGAVGAVCAVGLTWGVSRVALDMPWRFAPRENLAGMVVTALLVAGVGVAASFDILRRKPLATLRSE